jgi:alpha-glucosidase
MTFIYYGDELGMSNGVIPHNAIRDTIAKFFPGIQKGRDPERTPMQWDDSPHAGFTNPNQGKPWLPINDNYKTVNVAHEDRDPQSMLSLYKKLISFRNSMPALRLGEYISLNSNSAQVFSFEVKYGDERYLVSMNFSSNVERELLPKDAHSPAIIFSTAPHITTVTLPRSIELMPYEGYVVKL